MAIPKEILSIERPKSTVVRRTGNIYYVIKRTSVYKNGKSVPKDLGTIGKIIDSVYVPLVKNEESKKIKPDEITIKDYGEIALCNLFSEQILKELNDVYDDKTSKTLLTIALLRSAYGNITDRDLKFQYDTSFLSELYPGIALSEASVCNFLETIGMAYTRIIDFMKNRVSKLDCNSNCVLDGTLKDNNSKTNSFSEFSRKGRTKGSKDLSLLYLYDLNTCEPVCSHVYQGNMLDLTSFDDFVSKFSIKDGLMVLDKGFYNKETLDNINKTGSIRYILPLKKTSKIIVDNNADKDYGGILDYKEKIIHFKKTKIDDFKYLYSFKDDTIAQIEQLAYIKKNTKKGTYSESKLEKVKCKFGLIVFESNVDKNPLEIYLAYEKRWEIELMFQFYKNIINLNKVRVQTDYRIYATEFINFISTLISCKVRNKFNELKLSEKYSYKQIMLYLSKIKKFKVSGNEWKTTKLLKYTEEIGKLLSIV